MKIAIMADTHDNIANLEKFLGKVKADGVEGVIHCGDVTTPETLDWLAENFAGLIKLVCGNAEIRREEFAGVAKKYQNLEVFPEIGEWKLDGLELAFIHKPSRITELVRASKYNFVFYGHTHRPWISGEGLTTISNPGTLGGVFTAPTFAILDTKTGKLELKRLYGV